MKNKKASSDSLAEHVIFITLNLMFFVILLFFVVGNVSSTAELEENYAKKVALIIDSMNSGTNVTLDISELYQDAIKNKYAADKVLVYLQDDLVIVKLSETSKQSFRHFSNLTPKFYFDKEKQTMIIST